MTEPAPQRRSGRSRLATLGAAVFCAGLCGAAALFLLTDELVLELRRVDGAWLGRLRGAPDLVPLPPWRWIAERVTDACIGVGGALWLLSGALGALGRALSNLFRRGGGG